jgi:hypothetical protein
MKNIIFGVLFVSSLIYARTYEVPPTSSTRGSVPVISDEKMEECVKLYNDAKWLSNEINSMYVNQYDSNSVNNYNNKVRKHSSMIRKFNAECAGKQSYSAWKAAQKLNKGQ